MSVHRSRSRTIMSVLTLLIWAVIAAALVKFAFFPSTTDAQESGLDPTAHYGQMTVTAQTGTVENSMSLEGTIRSDTATAVGALCGIIPALAAIRVRPIDAIRY